VIKFSDNIHFPIFICRHSGDWVLFLSPGKKNNLSGPTGRAGPYFQTPEITENMISVMQKPSARN
jgi:hypothetical protein